MQTNRLFRSIGFVKKAAIKEATGPASLPLRAGRKVSLSVAWSVRGPIGPMVANQACQRSAPPPRAPRPAFALPVSARRLQAQAQNPAGEGVGRRLWRQRARGQLRCDSSSSRGGGVARLGVSRAHPSRLLAARRPLLR